jgi:hypothetical protein
MVDISNEILSKQIPMEDIEPEVKEVKKVEIQLCGMKRLSSEAGLIGSYFYIDKEEVPEEYRTVEVNKEEEDD